MTCFWQWQKSFKRDSIRHFHACFADMPTPRYAQLITPMLPPSSMIHYSTKSLTILCVKAEKVLLELYLKRQVNINYGNYFFGACQDALIDALNTFVLVCFMMYFFTWQTFQTIKEVQLKKYHETENPEEKAKITCNPWELLHKAVENSKPFLETSPIKRGGHTYQVPVPIRESKQQALAIKWLIEAGKTKESELKFYKKFAYEIIDAANGSVSWPHWFYFLKLVLVDIMTWMVTRINWYVNLCRVKW